MSLTLGLMALAVSWSQRPAGFATPAACLDAYREASLAGNLEQYWSCLSDPLRAELHRQHPNPKQLSESLRREAKDVKTWVQRLDSPSAGSTVEIDVDEVRMDGSRRIHFHLQKIGTGWFIADIATPKGIPAGIPYGTHVSKVPEESPRAPP